MPLTIVYVFPCFHQRHREYCTYNIQSRCCPWLITLPTVVIENLNHSIWKLLSIPGQSIELQNIMEIGWFSVQSVKCIKPDCFISVYKTSLQHVSYAANKFGSLKLRDQFSTLDLKRLISGHRVLSVPKMGGPALGRSALASGVMWRQ